MTISIYAAILALFYIYQSILVISVRRSTQTALGQGTDPHLQALIRAHANFAEYTPFALILIAFVEVSEAGTWLVHLLGIAFIVGRILHHLAITAPQGPVSRMHFRIAGMMLTFAVLGLSAFILLGKAFFPLTL